MQVDAPVGDVGQIRRVGRALDGRAVDAILDEKSLERRPGQDRLPHERVIPRHRQSVRTKPDARAVQEHRPVIATTDVVFASPDGLHGCPGRLSDVHRVADEVRVGDRAPAETTAEEHGVDVDLRRLQSRDLRGELLVARLELRAGPDLALAVADADRAVQRFHRGVREVRDHVLRLDRFRGFRERRTCIAHRHGTRAVLSRELVKLLAQGTRVEPGVRTEVPVDLQGFAPLPRRPEVVGDDRHAARHAHDLAHARHRERAAVVDGFDAAAEHGRTRGHGRQQSGEVNVHAELRRVVDFRRVEAASRVADHAPTSPA